MEQSFQNTTTNLGNLAGNVSSIPNTQSQEANVDNASVSQFTQNTNLQNNLSGIVQPPVYQTTESVIPPVSQPSVQQSSSIYSSQTIAQNTTNVTINPSPVSQIGENIVSSSNTNLEQTVAQPQYVQQISQQQANNSAAAQVVTPSQTVSSQVGVSVNEVVSQVSEMSVETSQQPEINRHEQPLIVDDYSIPVEKFRTMIKTIKLAANCNKNIPISQIIEIFFTSKGLIAKGTDMLNTLTYIDDTIRFVTELNIAIEIATLDKLVDKFDEGETVQVIPNLETGIITLMCENGEYIFQQQNDPQTFEPLHIPDSILPANTDPVAIDFELLKEKVTRADALCADSGLSKTLMSVCLSDRIYASDSNNAYAEPNLPELANETFCLAHDTVQIIKSLNLEDETVKIAFNKDDSGIIRTVHIYNNYFKLDCNVDENQDIYPLDTIRSLLTINYDLALQIPRVDVLKVLDRATVFIESNTDEDCSVFTVSSNNLNVSSKNGRAKINVGLEGIEFNLPVFEMNIKKVIDALSNLSEDIVTLSITKGEQSIVCISSGDITQMISIQENE